MLSSAVLALLAFGQANVLTETKQDLPYYDVPEAYQVYGVVISGGDLIDFSAVQRIVIQQQVFSFPPSFFQNSLRKCFPSDVHFLSQYKDVLNDYAKRVSVPRVLAPKFPLEKPYTVVPEVQIAKLTNHQVDAWGSIDPRFLNSLGYVVVSVVGFNASKTQALVWMARVYPGEGHGSYYLLEKRGGKWAEVPGFPTCGYVE